MIIIILNFQIISHTHTVSIIIEELSQEIDNFKLTLNQINTCLHEENDQSKKHSDLLNLKNDLQELIELKEHELLNYRKAQLLTEVNSLLLTTTTTTDNDNNSNDQERIDVAVEETPCKTNLSTIKNDQQSSSFIGKRCSVPGWTAAGKFIRQNALILSIVDDDHDRDDDGSGGGGIDSDCRVRVILAHPTRVNEIPCEQFFQTGTCLRGIRCIYSHGKIFNIEDIGEWYEPDTEKYLHEGQPCLANNPKSDQNSCLWHYARLLQTDFESGTCIIEWGHVSRRQSDKNSAKRQSYENLEDQVVSLPLECVHILEGEEDVNDDDGVESDVSLDSYSSSSSSSSTTTSNFEDCHTTATTTTATSSYCRRSSSEQTTETPSCSQSNKHCKQIQFVHGSTLLPNQLSNPIVVNVEQQPNITNEAKQNSIGDWEAHTRGIGSRLLANMGYPGYGGLGRCHQGHQFPVCTNLEKYQIHNHKWNHRPSLDNVVLLRRRKCRKGTTTSRRSTMKKPMEQSNKNKLSSSQQQQTSHHSSHSGNIFQLINMALLLPKSKSTDDDDDVNQTSHGRSSSNSRTKPHVIIASSSSSHHNSLLNCNETMLKRKLFHTHEQINRLNNQLTIIHNTIQRNAGRDRIAVKQAQKRIDALQAELIQLKENERTIVNIQNKQLKEKKLRIF
ncbi:unnamed protein product [Schistosoma turkestanicum]|nr:unnamed protein product [Schistosoma turkestanicum]